MDHKMLIDHRRQQSWTICSFSRCINEEVPFAKAQNNRIKDIFKRRFNYKFYTVSNNGKWYKHGNLSYPETIYFHEGANNFPPPKTMDIILQCTT